MKLNFLKTAFIAASLVAVSCGDDDSPVDPGTGNEGVLQGTVLEGQITEDLLVPAGQYTLKGAVSVEDGATLTIEAGTTFTVTAADQEAGVNVLFVKQGGKLIANGDANNPIVFTSENKNADGGDGDWGGLVLHGKARMNAPGGTSNSEAGQFPYGGTDDSDSSGSLKYVRVEYAGQASSDGEFEFNAFSFFACGSGTVVEYCEAFEGADDGFEFYGGTVNAKNLSAVGMEDDSIDWDEGFRGSIDNAVLYQYDGVGDFAFELANRSGENNASPRSKATVSNVTVRGSNRSGKAAFDLKQGTGGIFNNIVVTNVETVIFLNNQLQEVVSGDLEFTNANFTFGTNLIVNNVDGTNVTASLISTNATATGADVSAFAGWSNYSSL
ncbi:multidrug transporter [Leeuwenhoekiella aequorea]|uniref:Multidrug transporter n=1 Tax=Leeuwenhoekiella aequorea TaxID=283736 RepID=A0A4Q0PCU9_9FLAO|nr:multidrug transporter [Leeuwenhoekiella aequorea]RXG24595.1 hypothetical protein DSM00_385 [Leeuwenhoekiella aequorea]